MYYFFIDLVKELGCIFNVLLLVVGFEHAPCETLVFDDSIIDLHDFIHRKNMNYYEFPNIFQYQFWHAFLMSFVIDFGTILIPSWYRIQCCVAIVFLMLAWIGIL